MFNIFVLGAGFSKPAGMPLGSELFPEVLRRAKTINLSDLFHEGINRTKDANLYEGILRQDIESFLKYSAKLKNSSITEDEINFEEFLSYLDIEHYLGLRGSHTWSREGNMSQMIIKNLLAQVLFEKMSSIKEEDYDLYESFVRHLNPDDLIITFNYDTILETCFENSDKAYRFFPHRLSYVGELRGLSPYGGTIDTEHRREVVLLKVHGSIDWFDIEPYERHHKDAMQQGSFRLPEHTIFNNPTAFKPKKIIEGPYFERSLLNRIYRVRNLEEYFKNSNLVSEAPLILPPSSNKIVYLNALREFWTSSSSYSDQPVFAAKNVIVIGFSLPKHDDYITQPLFGLISKTQDLDPEVVIKPQLKIVDYRGTDDDRQEFRNRYPFVNWNSTQCYFDGFNEQAIEMIFEES